MGYIKLYEVQDILCLVLSPIPSYAMLFAHLSAHRSLGIMAEEFHPNVLNGKVTRLDM